MSGHASIQHFVTLRKSGIKSLYDYRGKRISIGQPGSSTAAMGVAMLEVLGDQHQTVRPNGSFDPD